MGQACTPVRDRVQVLFFLGGSAASQYYSEETESPELQSRLASNTRARRPRRFESIFHWIKESA
jgi:hypothetical protein